MQSNVAPWPYFEPDELEAVNAVLRSGKINYWTGEESRLFEREFAEFAGCRYGIALANGTLALELALRVLGLKCGDEVVVTPRTFIASASCAIVQGIRVVFADVDRDSQNITAETIERALTPNTKAIIAVHLAGWACDMDSIMTLARERGLKVIEDCAQCHGATYKGRPTGSLGDISAWSFCQDKIMTTGGEGGMLTLNDPAQWSEAWSYKDHGKSHEAVYDRAHAPGFRWLHESFGTNWRITELQSAIGRLQLRKMPQWTEARRRNAGVLIERLAASPLLRIPVPPAEIGHAYYKFYAFARPERLKPDWTRDRIMVEISRRGTPCFSGSCGEIYLEKAFDVGGMRPAERLPVAQELGETSLMFLVHPTLSVCDMEAMAEVINEVCAEATWD